MRKLQGLVIIALAACGEVTSSPIDAGNVCTPACGANATCQGATCVCDDGYQAEGAACVDVDECATGNGGCDANATCTNTPGDRTCACNPGYLGDGAACRPVWAIQGTFPFDINPSNFGSVFVAHNASVFIGIETNTPTAKGWRAFNTANLQLSGPLNLPPAASDDFCACGATQTLVSDGTTIFMFGNYAQKYDPVGNAWTEIPNYTSGTDFRRAESASVFNPMSGRIEIFGGRGPVAATVSFDRSTQQFMFGADLPIAISDAVAYLPPSSGTIFLAGGEQQGAGDRILSRPTSLPSWVINAAAPGSIRSPIGMGDFGTRIWVASRDGNLYLYDPTTMMWDRQVPLPERTQGVVTTPQGTFAFVHTTAATLEVYKLMAIE